MSDAGKLLAVTLVVFAGLAPARSMAGEHSGVPAGGRGSASAAPGQPPLTGTPAVNDTLRALDRLHSFGYVVSTEARANRAIRSWQSANRLAVDGIVGPETLHSLGLDGATATAPAVRQTPPAPTITDPEAIIRDVWPDELEEHALAIASRESRLVPTARNSCCFGLFQLNWSAHRGWLAGIGITAPAELLDARTNATAALALFEMDGWRPWALP